MDEDSHIRNSDGNNERSPLIGGPEFDEETYGGRPTTPEPRPKRPQRPRGHSRLASIASSIKDVNVPKARSGNTIVWILCLVILIGSSSAGFSNLPLTRIVEDILCHQYYDRAQSLEEPIDESLCKVDEVQKKMAYIFAVNEALSAIFSMVAVFPWGIAADRIGRRPVLSLAIIGLTLNVMWMAIVGSFPQTLPVKAIWLGPAFALLGGGNAMVAAAITGMISDVIPEASRAVAMMRVQVSSNLGNLFSPSAAAFMMERTGPWPPLFTSMGLLAVCAISMLFVPETAPHKPVSEEEESEYNHTGLAGRVHNAWARLKESFGILNSASLIILLLAHPVSIPVILSTMQFLNQFVSKRYGLKIAQTGYLQTVYGMGNLVVAFAIIPLLSRYLMNVNTPKLLRKLDDSSRDLALAKWSAVIAVVGAVILGLSPTVGAFIFGLVVLSLGSGLSSLITSLMSRYIDAEHRTRLFSLAGIINMVGYIAGSPVLAAGLSAGLSLGGDIWIGLPYFLVAIMAFTVVIALMFVRVPKTPLVEAALDEERHAYVDE